MNSLLSIDRRSKPLGRLAAVSLSILMSVSATQSTELQLRWKLLPPLPDKLGLGGPLAGVSGDALIVGGGSNFTGKMPWEGGSKSWYDTAFVLTHPDAKWQNSFKLPHVCAYAVSVTAPEGVVCIGGADAQKHLASAFLLQWTGGKLAAKPLPPLPFPAAYACGALVGRSVYVAGGSAAPDATSTLKRFVRLNLDQLVWEELEPWPGRGRMLAAAAAVDGSFYLAGGTDLAAGADGKPVRTYLKDAFCFTPGSGWKRIADMPNPVVAAPTPAPNTGKPGFLLVGGDDGSLVNFEPKSKHPGFPKRVLAYDADQDQWSVGETPAARATLPSAPWHGMVVLPSGEAKPGVRSPEVWAVTAP